MTQGSGHRLWPLLLGLGLGCAGEPPTPEAVAAPAPLGERFDPRATGTITGRLHWRGAVPEVPAFHSPPTPVQVPPRPASRTWPNPNAPRIDTSSSGVGDVAMFLRGVDLSRSRPWDHTPVRVEQRDLQILIRQNDGVSRIGFARRGDEMEMISFDPIHHMLRVRGTEFFTVPFPDLDRVQSRRLSRPGLVELSSGAGRFWMRGYVLVAEHPYFARTDSQGGFTLEQVPEGDHELVVWMPNWHVAEVTNDPGLGLAKDVRFAAPVEIRRLVRIRRGQTVSVEVDVTRDNFGR